MGVQDSGRISPKRPFSVRLSSSVEPSSVRFEVPTLEGPWIKKKGARICRPPLLRVAVPPMSSVLEKTSPWAEMTAGRFEPPQGEKKSGLNRACKAPPRERGGQKARRDVETLT